MIYFDRVEVVNVLDRDHGKTIVETTTTKTRSTLATTTTT